MLKGIHPLLTPELLKVLAEMGHDEAIVLTDANFSAMHVAAGKPLLRLPGIDMLSAITAVCSVFPLAADVDCPVAYMQVGQTEAPYRSALQREVLAALAADLRPGQDAEAIERFAFYERARRAYAVVVTGELQPYGNFILRKGVIDEALRP
ncbi:RbsD/FucU family protein [Propionivibrio dicarboxylicus]|uniref:L-fucose mutarotase n=1 Tax=Propionivibrio dicarboxylicus TaxID=83767 RepID=A0A1G8E9T0_9RHOO|nr:RbsD/FucU domain-containing protein [Propionivibrio dicarboxylicus]SDH66634.1 L-fucose mutarotase [Propionivibrio dicarboxylicus]